MQKIDGSPKSLKQLLQNTKYSSRYHRKRFKLSQKEIEKRIAHGQKSDGYEEYEMTMY